VNSQINLNPGELYFGDQFDEIKTLLGSCVAAVLWHPRFRMAGMCHVIHPGVGADGNYSYAESAIRKLHKDVSEHLMSPAEFNVEVIGGGNMFPEIGKNTRNNIGKRNSDFVVKLLTEHGFNISRIDVGGTKARKISLFRESGKVVTVYVKESSYAK